MIPWTSANYTSIFHLSVPGTAPTAPYAPEQPSMMLASHSTWPCSVRFEPRPAFVIGSSYSKGTKFMIFTLKKSTKDRKEKKNGRHDILQWTTNIKQK